jgi:hypothetical protein
MSNILVRWADITVELNAGVEVLPALCVYIVFLVIQEPRSLGGATVIVMVTYFMAGRFFASHWSSHVRPKAS